MRWRMPVAPGEIRREPFAETPFHHRAADRVFDTHRRGARRLRHDRGTARDRSTGRRAHRRDGDDHDHDPGHARRAGRGLDRDAHRRRVHRRPDPRRAPADPRSGTGPAGRRHGHRRGADEPRPAAADGHHDRPHGRRRPQRRTRMVGCDRPAGQPPVGDRTADGGAARGPGTPDRRPRCSGPVRGHPGRLRPGQRGRDDQGLRPQGRDACRGLRPGGRPGQAPRRRVPARPPRGLRRRHREPQGVAVREGPDGHPELPRLQRRGDRARQPRQRRRVDLRERDQRPRRQLLGRRRSGGPRPARPRPPQPAPARRRRAGTPPVTAADRQARPAARRADGALARR
ncbi:hypothetical protein CURTO8I2_180120 [Curtobacterium sp. 8I-2]|nr:hypothetical protein CURTO8I2_180120 [Curtobacterium sp. 8I-2]